MGVVYSDTLAQSSRLTFLVVFTSPDPWTSGSVNKINMFNLLLKPPCFTFAVLIPVAYYSSVILKQPEALASRLCGLSHLRRSLFMSMTFVSSGSAHQSWHTWFPDSLCRQLKSRRQHKRNYSQLLS